MGNEPAKSVAHGEGRLEAVEGDLELPMFPRRAVLYVHCTLPGPVMDSIATVTNMRTIGRRVAFAVGKARVFSFKKKRVVKQ